MARIGFVGPSDADAPIVGVGFDTMFRELCAVRKINQQVLGALLRIEGKMEAQATKADELMTKGDELILKGVEMEAAGDRVKDATDRLEQEMAKGRGGAP